MEGKSNILTPKQVFDMYYLDVRWHLLEVGAMLDRVDRGNAAHPDTAATGTDLRPELLREALAVLASDSPEPNRVERMQNIFTKMDPKMRKVED